MDKSSDSDGVKAISLFSGVGGLDIGLHQVGIDTVACVDKDETVAKSLRINSKKHDSSPDTGHLSVPKKYPWTVIENDIRELEAEDILEAANVAREEIELVVGGPPCQTFSRSNEGNRTGTDTERGKLYREFARILHQVQPRAFLFENVRGLKSANDGKDLEIIREELEGDNYITNYKVLNAANYGVPQTRKRIFIIGIKGNQKPTFPDPTHTENGEDGTEEWETVGEALKGFNVDEEIEEKGGYRNAIGSKYGDLLTDIPEGANYQHFSERKYDTEREEYVHRTKSELDEKKFDWRSRHWNYLLKIDRDRPSWTIQAEPGTTVGPFHWRARKLSLLEQMRLMELPLDYYIAGQPAQIQKQIGNAVPPRLIEAVARNLLEDLSMTPGSLPDEESRTVASNTTGQPPFEVEITPTESPWQPADRILHGIQAKDAVIVKAHLQAIPYAVDALEIADRQIDQELGFEVDEEVIEVENGKYETASRLVAKAIDSKTIVNLTASS